ncbi:YlbE-like family protein [Lentibacillus salicampi]|uniref:YlbE-like protein n=1 Tax=Lentibacillus salicampi TaxID=175306 RepID=A0A4Y9AHV4_9BACI|nr:YlbE-like family protein [Lentibacillus salicampi]TFJ94540.1 hypothetical protein E4U82_01090 [Lentibacillus salicampi]
MQETVYHYLSQRPELAHFVRFNPEWYRFLTREPHRVEELEKASKVFYGKTFSQQVDKISGHVQMLNMLINFTEAMKD